MENYVRMTLPAHMLTESDIGADLLRIDGKPIAAGSVTRFTLDFATWLPKHVTYTIGWFASA